MDRERETERERERKREKERENMSHSNVMCGLMQGGRTVKGRGLSLQMFL